MNRFLQFFNFGGVIALVVLSIAQWQANSRLEGDVDRLERTRVAQLAKISEQETTLKDDAADLEDLRQRLSLSESQLKATIIERGRLSAESRQLKAALDKWMAAVKQRDGEMQQANGLIQKLAGERNDAIVKFNDLADKYNAMVKQVQGSK